MKIIKLYGKYSTFPRDRAHIKIILEILKQIFRKSNEHLTSTRYCRVVLRILYLIPTNISSIISSPKVYFTSDNVLSFIEYKFHCLCSIGMIMSRSQCIFDLNYLLLVTDV